MLPCTTRQSVYASFTFIQLKTTEMHRIPTLHLPCAEKKGEQNPLGTEKDSKAEKKKAQDIHGW